jgi:hypothetical protein
MLDGIGRSGQSLWASAPGTFARRAPLACIGRGAPGKNRPAPSVAHNASPKVPRDLRVDKKETDEPKLLRKMSGGRVILGQCGSTKDDRRVRRIGWQCARDASMSLEL